MYLIVVSAPSLIWYPIDTLNAELSWPHVATREWCLAPATVSESHLGMHMLFKLKIPMQIFNSKPFNLVPKIAGADKWCLLGESLFDDQYLPILLSFLESFIK